MKLFQAVEYAARQAELGGWAVGITTYRLGERWRCKVDNVSPGAIIARGEGATLAEAEAEALGRARVRLATTRRISAA